MPITLTLCNLIIEFVFHHRFSAFLVIEVLPNFIDTQRLTAGLQNQRTGYNHNLTGGALPNLAVEFIPLFTLTLTL